MNNQQEFLKKHLNSVGRLDADGVAVPVREERDLFRLAGVPWVEPEARSLGSPNKKVEAPK
jgi:hypothetical protein